MIGNPTCTSCGEPRPAYYLTAGVCFECKLAGTLAPKRIPPPLQAGHRSPVAREEIVAALAAVDRQRLAEAMRMLSEPQRLALTGLLDGRSDTETAAARGVSQPAVTQAVARALARLRTMELLR